MTDRPEHSFRFQLSLRTLMLLVTLVAVTIGGMRWLLFWNFEIFQAVLMLLTTIVPFLLAIGTIVWFGIRHRRTGLALWGGALLLLPLLGTGVLWLLARTVGSNPGGLGVVSTAQLIQTRLPQQIDQPWAWRELQSRLQDGDLSPQQVDAAVQALIAHMTKTKPAGWDQPLSWQREFLSAAVQAGAVSDPVLFALCDAFYGPKPVIQPVERIREGVAGLDIQVDYGSNWSTNSGLGVDLLWQVKRVLVDGKPIDVEQGHKFSKQWSGRYPGSLEAGDHQLTVEVQCAYIDEAKLIGLNADRLEVNRWPKPRKQWLAKVSAPLKVYSLTPPIVALDTDPSHDPGKTGGIEVERLVAQSGPDGTSSIILKLKFTPALTIPVSCDVSVLLGDRSLRLGRMWAISSENSLRSGGSSLEANIADLDPALRSADIILRPNPAHIEHVPDAEKIWGKPLILQGMPVERLDLEAGAANSDR